MQRRGRTRVKEKGPELWDRVEERSSFQLFQQTDFSSDTKNHLGAACCSPKPWSMNWRRGELGMLCFHRAGRTMAAGLQVQPGLQAISAHACSHVNSHRITLAGLFFCPIQLLLMLGVTWCCALWLFWLKKVSWDEQWGASPFSLIRGASPTQLSSLAQGNRSHYCWAPPLCLNSVIHAKNVRERKHFLLSPASPWRWLSGRCISEIPVCASIWSPFLPTSGCLIWGGEVAGLMTEQEHLARCDSQPSLGETSLVWQPSYLLGRELSCCHAKLPTCPLGNSRSREGSQCFPPSCLQVPWCFSIFLLCWACDRDWMLGEGI